MKHKHVKCLKMVFVAVSLRNLAVKYHLAINELSDVFSGSKLSQIVLAQVSLKTNSFHINDSSYFVVFQCSVIGKTC